MKQLIPLDLSIFQSIEIAIRIVWIIDGCVIFLVAVIMLTYLLSKCCRWCYRKLVRQQIPATDGQSIKFNN
jgi:hypothetical protein